MTEEGEMHSVCAGGIFPALGSNHEQSVLLYLFIDFFQIFIGAHPSFPLCSQDVALPNKEHYRKQVKPLLTHRSCIFP